MDIRRDNYESWFLDFLDGKLDAGQKEKFLSFLEFNPDLKKELYSLKGIVLEPEEMSYDRKTSLKKPVGDRPAPLSDEEFERLCISGIEQELNPEEEHLLSVIIRDDPRRNRIHRLFQSTILEADQQISYSGKKALKKRVIRIPQMRMMISMAAAAALILFVLSIYFRFYTPDTEQEIASQSTMGPESQNQDAPVGGNTYKSQPPAGDVPSGSKVTPSDNGDEAPVGDQASSLIEKGNLPAEHQASSLHDGDKEPFISDGHNLRKDPLYLARIDPLMPEPFSHPGISMPPALVLPDGSDGSGNTLTLQEFAMERIRKRVLDDEEDGKLSLWKLADAGFERINQWSGEDYSMERKVDENGKTRRITFESPVFGISTPLGNADHPR
jgi:hypothetical protein